MSAYALGALLEWLIWGLFALLATAVIVHAAEWATARGGPCPVCHRPGGGHYPDCPRANHSATSATSDSFDASTTETR